MFFFFLLDKILGQVFFFFFLPASDFDTGISIVSRTLMTAAPSERTITSTATTTWVTKPEIRLEVLCNQAGTKSISQAFISLAFLIPRDPPSLSTQEEPRQSDGGVIAQSVRSLSPMMKLTRWRYPKQEQITMG